MQRYTLDDHGETTQITGATDSSSWTFTVPMAKASLVAAIKALLDEPETREQIAGAIFLVKNSTDLKIHVGSGCAVIPLVHVFPFVMA
ncbi:hypothetical protein LX70_00560 [Defluviimonas denitrificans]|jgi:hypothetical protein|uniref:Uncharacterized protein n=1 Tax=Albidovulum denitrificans TaxID=404881 RepID=A0A2S8SD16_9RHOB|nr:hypothetical protein [Defluviimonas denitrificans]PQV58747.1 hypothetical protein LX70_00560 [Defluviimonas denitrificans]